MVEWVVRDQQILALECRFCRLSAGWDANEVGLTTVAGLDILALPRLATITVRKDVGRLSMARCIPARIAPLPQAARRSILLA